MVAQLALLYFPPMMERRITKASDLLTLHQLAEESGSVFLFVSSKLKTFIHEQFADIAFPLRMTTSCATYCCRISEVGIFPCGIQRSVNWQTKPVRMLWATASRWSSLHFEHGVAWSWSLYWLKKDFGRCYSNGYAGGETTNFNVRVHCLRHGAWSIAVWHRVQ